MNSNKPWYSTKYFYLLPFIGAMLWLAGGIILSLRPEGNPPHSFRKSADLMPLMGLGLVLIGVSHGFKMLSLKNTGGRFFQLICRAIITSSLLYALGLMIRHFFLNATGWEPFMPFGFLAFIISWAMLGVVALKNDFLPRPTCLVIIASAISLISFNDQYNPYGAIAFGILMFILVFLSLYHHYQFKKSGFA